MPLIPREEYPCWTCTAYEAADVRHWMGQTAIEDIGSACSPVGEWPPGCCHVRVAAVTRSPDVAAARAMEERDRNSR